MTNHIKEGDAHKYAVDFLKSISEETTDIDKLKWLARNKINRNLCVERLYRMVELANKSNKTELDPDQLESIYDMAYKAAQALHDVIGDTSVNKDQKGLRFLTKVSNV